MARFRDEAYVLARYPYRERDLVLALLTRGQGQLRALIRGVRGARRGRAAMTESLCQIVVEGFQKEGSELATLEDVSLISSSFSLARNPAAWVAGQVVAELALVYCPPGQRSEPSYRLVDRCVQGLLRGLDPVLVAQYAELWFLRLAGVFPPLERCGRCGEALVGPQLWFDAAEECLVCARHRPAGSPVSLTEDDLNWLRLASRVPVEQVERPASAGAQVWLAGLRASFTDREVRSWKSLREMADAGGVGPRPSGRN